MNFLRIILACSLFLVFSVTGSAQLKTPAASPLATLSQRVGLTDLSISYSRPAKRGRVIFGKAGIIPDGETWRTGANAATKFTTSDDLTIAGQVLPKGEYALLTIPTASSITVQFHPYTSSSWSSYVDQTPALSTATNLSTSSEIFEVLSMDIIPSENAEAATLKIAWDNRVFRIELALPTRKNTLASIAKMEEGPNWFDYFKAATYLHTSKEDLPQALVYIKKSNDSPDVRFFQKYREALILKDLGKNEEALIAANHSLKLSEEAQNGDFIRLNTSLIKELKN